MSDHIDDKELEELNEIYRRKMEAQKSHESKKAKHEKSDKIVKNENTHSEKSLNDKKTVISAKSEKPARTEKQIKVKPEKQDKEEKAQQESKPLTDDERKKKLALRINIGVCTVFFAVVAVGLLVLPRPTVSESEKRNLATFPKFTWDTYWNGDYTEDISYFFNDTVPFRDTFKSIGAGFRSLFGFSINGAEIKGSVSQVNSGSSQTEVTTASTKPIAIVTPAPSDTSSDAPESKDETSSKDNSNDSKADTSKAETSSKPDESNNSSKPENVYIAPSDPDAQVLYEEGSQLVYQSGDTIYGAQLYNGNRDNAEDYANTLNTLKTLLPYANVYSMLALTQNTFITPAELEKTKYTELSDSEYISNMLDKNIKVIDTMNALLPHQKENLFFLRDCHWQQLGAYYAAQSFAKSAGVNFAKLSDYDKYEEDCLGSVYAATQYEGLMYEGETFTYYVPKNEYTTDYYNEDYEYQFEYPLMPRSDYNTTAFYSLFMVADSYIKHITTDVNNDRVLVVLKDDYPSAMIPCLTSSFSEIYVIDVRYCNFNVADFCVEKGATDVLVGMTTENALGEIGDTLSYLLNI
jgi:hypothetical protein